MNGQTYELVTRAGVEAEVARQTARFETREKNFGFKPGEHYYSPVTYTWPDFYNGANSKWAKFLEFGNTLGIVILNRSSGDWLSKRPDVILRRRVLWLLALVPGACLSISRRDTALCSRVCRFLIGIRSRRI